MRRQQTRRGATAAPKAAVKSGAKATPEAATAKARTTGGRGATRKAVPTPEAATAKARTGVVAKKAAPAGRTAGPAAKAAPAKKAAAKPTKVAPAKKAAAKPTKVAPAKKAAATPKKAAPAKKAAAKPTKAAAVLKKTAATLKKAGSALKKKAPARATRTRGASAPLAPETLPRARRTVDRPTDSRQKPARAPRDRSQRQAPGLRELEWPQMALAARNLAKQIARTWTPELVIGVAKGGVFAGQEVATSLRVPFFPVRVGKRSRDAGHRSPEAAASMPTEATGKRVLVVDDIAGSGATLQAATTAVEAAGAIEVRTATLVVRAGGFMPDFFGVETADLVVFPWDYEATTGAVGSGASGDEDESADEDYVPDEDEIDTFGV